MSTAPPPLADPSPAEACPAQAPEARLTLAHYEARAEAFWAGTRDHDVQQNRAALLRHVGQVPGVVPPYRLLDLGCGPGRDLRVFRELGHEAIGLDGAPRFVEMARAWSGCEVWLQDLCAPELPAARFDGIYANASLFHVPAARLPQVLAVLRQALRAGGVLFASNPRGRDEEGWLDGRYGCWHSLEGWRRHLGAAGFDELEHYYRPEGQPRERQPWLASVWRRREGTTSAA